jgi:acyl-CoA reductase-like NAD-dependent aldehyde dehydrogenase
MIPALLAGNTVVLKASPENSLSMMLLADLFDELGLPEGVVSILPADRETSEYLVAHPDIDKVAFTGSTGAGRAIAAVAGQQLKRVSLELGGKSAAIILSDADLNEAVPALQFSSLGNNGEACIAQTRVLAPRSRYEEVVTAAEHGLEIARRIRTGTFTVNTATIGFDGPFGGNKASGTGREYGAVGLTEYVEHKTITIPA